MKDIIKLMFQGWIIREESYNGTDYTKDETECMVEACDGDILKGNMIYLFSYWGNDIQSLAPHYGLFLDRNEEGKLYIREDIPSAPSIEHYWRDGAWQEPNNDYEEVEVVRTGSD